jgi:hypothetical protein
VLGFACVVVVAAGVVAVVVVVDVSVVVVLVELSTVGVLVSPGTVSVGVVGSGSAAFLLLPPPHAARNGISAVKATVAATRRDLIG